MFRRNEDVKKAKGRIPNWAIGEKIGIHESTVYRWMRNEMTPERKKQVLAAIEELKNELKDA